MTVQNAVYLTTTGLCVKDSTPTYYGRTMQATSNQTSIANANGVAGNPTYSLADNAELPGTGSVTIPTGTTAGRPGTPSTGEIRGNTTDNELEFWDGSQWVRFVDANGTYIKISETTLSGASSIEFTNLSSDYLVHWVVMNNVKTTTRGTLNDPSLDIKINYSSDNGATYPSNFFANARLLVSMNGTAPVLRSQSTNYPYNMLEHNVDTSGNFIWDAKIYIYNMTANQKTYCTEEHYYNHLTFSQRGVHGNVVNYDNIACNAFKIDGPLSFDSGTVKLYGLRI